jgi:hypothetical protein
MILRSTTTGTLHVWLACQDPWKVGHCKQTLHYLISMRPGMRPTPQHPLTQQIQVCPSIQNLGFSPGKGACVKSPLPPQDAYTPPQGDIFNIRNTEWNLMETQFKTRFNGSKTGSYLVAVVFACSTHVRLVQEAAGECNRVCGSDLHRGRPHHESMGGTPYIPPTSDKIYPAQG